MKNLRKLRSVKETYYRLPCHHNQQQQQQQQQHWWKMMLRRAESIFIDDFQAYANCHLTHSDVRRTK